MSRLLATVAVIAGTLGACGDSAAPPLDALVFDLSEVVAPGVVHVQYGFSPGDEFHSVQIRRRGRDGVALRVRVQKAEGGGPDSLYFGCVRVTIDPRIGAGRPRLVGWSGEPLHRSAGVGGTNDCHAPDVKD